MGEEKERPDQVMHSSLTGRGKEPGFFPVRLRSGLGWWKRSYPEAL